VLYSETLRDFLYSLEVQKAEEYIIRNGKKDCFNDWLYTLYMFNKHKEDHARVRRLVTGKKVLSYGDRVAQFMKLDVHVKYVDSKPSQYALSRVDKATDKVLRKYCKDPTSTVLLMYVWYGLTDQQKEILRSAKAQVIVWSYEDEPVLQYHHSGVSSNRPLSSSVSPTERAIFQQYPFLVNFSLFKRHIFLDTGIMMDYLIRTCQVDTLYVKGVPLKHYRGVKIEEAEAQEGEVYVAHSYETWASNLKYDPYLVPTGRKQHRLYGVSSPRTSYMARWLYRMEGPMFFPETMDANWSTLAHTSAGVVGFFRDVCVSPGLLVTDDVDKIEHCYVRRLNSSYRVEVNVRVFFIQEKNLSAQMDLMLEELRPAETKALLEYLLTQTDMLHVRTFVQSWLRKKETT
jgi:hypothetical protein